MRENINYEEARDLLLEGIAPLPAEYVPLSESAGRVLAEEIVINEDVPPFDRSPYDGYAFRAEDTLNASQENPVSLRILEEIPAGGVSHIPVTPGTAVKILTGAPIPDGADAVINYERTRFTDSNVTLFAPVQTGSNIVRAGEDVRRGDILTCMGKPINPGTAGVLAAQNISTPLVYRMPRVGIISTGSELQELGGSLNPGNIRDTSRYTFGVALTMAGCIPVFLGIAEDDERIIAEKITHGLDECDLLILTGGVSVGDYDRTPAAMALAGAETLVRDVKLKPGGKCVYAMKDGRLICCLSGNPASALTNYYSIALPLLRKLAGRKDFLPFQVDLTLADPFNKKSPQPRLLRGKLKFIDGTAFIDIKAGQGNAVLSNMAESDAMALVPAGSNALPAGTRLKGFLL